MDLNLFRELCIKEITGNLNNEERILLENWLAKSSENKIEYEKFKSVWTQSIPGKINSMPDTNTEWNILYNKLELNKIQKKSKESFLDEIYYFFQSTFISNWKPAMSGAFALLILAISIFVWNSDTSNRNYKLVATGNKEIKEVQLPDGSTVKLNRGSSIQYLENFNGAERHVKLNGEAFFSVTKNSHPFVVETGNAKVTVLGTKFDVMSRGEKTNVVVKEGKVKLAQKEENNNSVYLVKGQASSIIKNGNPMIPEDVNADYLLGWMSGKLVFDETPLSEIVVELEKFYDVPISIESNNISSNTLTGSFKNGDVDSVLTMICLTLNLDFEKQQNGYVIKTKKSSN